MGGRYDVRVNTSRVVPMVVLVLTGCGAIDPPSAPPAGQEAAAMPAQHAAPEPAPAHEHTNRLVHETSPYLLQHAHNPVDWYPWGPEAFEAARAADKPIFLSIGYSTCYWCHVMERESFENDEIAAVMNEHFICIKLDREERPDVDEIYMTATQLINRSGGWPMSVFLEPGTLKPFFAGTYFPADQFSRLLQQVHVAWTQQRDTLVADAGRIAEMVTSNLTESTSTVMLGPQHVDGGITRMLTVYDRTNGGFGRERNKFPMPAYLDLLVGAGWENPDARGALEHTLDRMATGGMYDQVGGGFHRYSTDRQWRVPHFEKMLYDNGQLASTYATAYERGGDPYYAQIVRETLDYVLREMTDPAGGFWSAQDAEADHREGADYIWLAEEIREALDAAGEGELAEFALQIYGLQTVRDPHHPEDGWKDVIYLPERPDALARSLGIEPDELAERRRRINDALMAAREQRPQPGTDDKILAAWNGLMIAGMADGGRVLNEPRYTDAARRAATFVLETMRADDGGLLRTYRAGEAKIPGLREDHALMVRGLVALHLATGESRWLDESCALAAAAKERFWDELRGGYFDTEADQADLFVRSKSTYDGAVPCGNSVMVNNLLDLYAATEDETYVEDAAAALRGMSRSVAQNPVSTSLSTLALARFPDEHRILLAGSTTPAPASPDAVRIELSASALMVTPDEPAALEVTLHIAEGYHINAHEPGPSFLIPLSLTVAGDGLTLVAEYPPGEVYRGPLAQEAMRVHHGRVTIPVRLETTGNVRGTPRIVVTYQVCTDKVCLAPRSEPLALDLTFPAAP
jgi:uncharacterized protein YyaL (SSP411 family)